MQSSLRSISMSQTKRILSCVCMMCCAIMLTLSFVGCSKQESQSPAGSTQAAAPAEQTKVLQIGTMPTEDFLPMWVAQEQGLFDTEKTGEVQFTVFPSAQELSAALSSGAIDMAMTDIPTAANLSKSGTEMCITWVTLGRTAAEGRFGIMVGPKSEIQSIEELKSVPIGVGSGTMLEYVMDKLLESKGFTKDEIKVEELKKIPVRLQAVMEGECAAGVFPATLLELGELQGARVLLDDTQGANLSQSIMTVRAEALKDPAMKQRIEAVRAGWNAAVESVSKDKDSAKTILLKNVKLPEPLQANYPIQNYPKAGLPSSEEVESVLSWMKEHKYLEKDMSYGSDGLLKFAQ